MVLSRGRTETRKEERPAGQVVAAWALVVVLAAAGWVAGKVEGDQVAAVLVVLVVLAGASVNQVARRQADARLSRACLRLGKRCAAGILSCPVRGALAWLALRGRRARLGGSYGYQRRAAKSSSLGTVNASCLSIVSRGTGWRRSASWWAVEPGARRPSVITARGTMEMANTIQIALPDSPFWPAHLTGLNPACFSRGAESSNPDELGQTRTSPDGPSSDGHLTDDCLIGP